MSDGFRSDASLECHRVRLQMSFIKKSSGEILIRNSDMRISWPRGVSQFLRDDENFPKFAFRQWGVRGGLRELKSQSFSLNSHDRV